MDSARRLVGLWAALPLVLGAADSLAAALVHPAAERCEAVARQRLGDIYAQELAYFALHGSYTRDLELLGPASSPTADAGAPSAPGGAPLRCTFRYEVRVRGPWPAFAAYAWGGDDARGMGYKVDSDGTSAGLMVRPGADEVNAAVSGW